jgi:hypothetical protein
VLDTPELLNVVVDSVETSTGEQLASVLIQSI